MEVETMILISKNLNFITDKDYIEIQSKIEEVGKILQGLIKSINQKTKIVNVL
jgi:four helix bundle protein